MDFFHTNKKLKMKKKLDGDLILSSEEFKAMEKPLIDLIAKTAIWVDPKKVSKRPVYPDKRRGNPDDKGKIINGVRIDDNTYANYAIKRAISKDAEFINYTTCHIWPGTAYDERYHTQLANLVLIPRVIAALSDHCPSVIDVLKYRAKELYGWYPEEESEPTRPQYYPEEWRSFESAQEVQNNIEYEDIEDYLDIDISEYYEESKSTVDKEEYSLAQEEYNNNREEKDMIRVINRVPGWVEKPHQINSTILLIYMKLSQNGEVPVRLEELQRLAEEEGVEKFRGNYNQMKNFGFRNHGKVFQEENGFVYLYKPVATFVKSVYENLER